MRQILLLTSILMVSTIAMAQPTGSIKGKLVDTASKQYLSDATISIVNSVDSSLVTFTLSEKEGNFQVKGLAPGKYRALISYHGYRTKKKDFTITTEKLELDLGVLAMFSDYKMLDEVVVTDDAPVKIKGDTIAFRADAFKTKPNATVEDLLKKMPGMQVEKDGTVKSQGENVNKVYVDGKEFFGNDPKLATKNLTADMIDQVEVFDDMSEQAKFNRIDDGSRSKSINLKLKKDKKKGIFGKIYGGYGTDQRYDAGINANFFKGSSQLALIAKANNTNNIGFTMSDMMGMLNLGGGGGGNMGGMMQGMQVVRMGGGGGNNFGGFNVGSGGSGITSSSQIGLNYRDTWSKTFDVTGSYFFNQAENENDRKSFRNTFLADSSIARDSRTNSLSKNNNHRFNMNLTINIDSFNSIIFSPNVSVQQSTTSSQDSSASFASKGSANYKINDTRSLVENEGVGFNWNNNIIYRRKFRRTGRTFSLTFNNVIGNNDRDGFNTTSNNFFNSSGDNIYDSVFRQNSETLSNTNNYGVSASYTEPLGKDKIFELNYGYNRNRSESDRETFDYNGVSGKYDIINNTLTNHFQNLNESNRFGANLRIIKKKYNYQLGFAVQNTLLESNNLSKNDLISQRFTNIYPTASFNYQFQKSRALRFNYRGRTNQPSATQLQPIRDVSNAPYYYEGNPNLGQEFTNNFSLNYNFFDIVKFRNLFAFVNFSSTSNKIVNATQSLPGGGQLSRPVNLNGALAGSGSFNIGFPIKKMKGGNFNTNTRINYNKNPNLIDNVKGFSKNMVIGEDLRLNYNSKEKLDLGIGASITYNSAEYTIQPQRNEKYMTHTYSADISYTLPHNFIVSTDFDYTFNTGRADGFNQNFAMWNSSIAKQLFKNKKGEIKLSVYDMLNENISISRNVGENYIEDVENLVLRRFFMFTFTYNLSRMAGKNMPMQKMIERGTRDIRMMH